MNTLKWFAVGFLITGSSLFVVIGINALLIAIALLRMMPISPGTELVAAQLALDEAYRQFTLIAWAALALSMCGHVHRFLSARETK